MPRNMQGQMVAIRAQLASPRIALRALCSFRFSSSAVLSSLCLALEMCVALLVVGVGVEGLTERSDFRRTVEAWINIHLLFGTLLCAWSAIRFSLSVRRMDDVSVRTIRVLSR